MSKDISIWDLPTSPANFADWATRQRRACSRRERLARTTGVVASSSWPTPTASDAGYFPDLSIDGEGLAVVKPIDIAGGSCGQFSVSNATRSWTLMWMAVQSLGLRPGARASACSLPVRVSFKHGPTSSLAGLISNPLFHEHLMGWPTGWTDAGASVTGFAAWLRRSRGELSKRLMSEIWAVEPDDRPLN